MTNWLERTELLIGPEAINSLQEKHVLVVGLGGVGSFAAEFLARAGVGKLTIVDGDVIDPTNINRQLPALHSTVAQSKAQLMEARIRDINPAIQLEVLEEFLDPERTWEVVQEEMDYVLDCIDSVSPKINLITACVRKNVKVISSMGAGGKTDPSQVKVTDISQTYHCNLARTIRKRLRKDKINKGVKAIFCAQALKRDSLKLTDGNNFKKSFYGTISYMPALFGLHAAATVIEELSA
ncbi:tRNA threonylcarbamoyladenosine dehydratase [Rapidithrix thailandica]|uniref:tRNA threonylcarbamoyladenosine dehydratase n=1 Tax=Rapidithrix thailandica TaxID=413964 RepID=A0AAW9SA23_9BACT